MWKISNFRLFSYLPGLCCPSTNSARERGEGCKLLEGKTGSTAWRNPEENELAALLPGVSKNGFAPPRPTQPEKAVSGGGFGLQELLGDFQRCALGAREPSQLRELSEILF